MVSEKYMRDNYYFIRGGTQEEEISSDGHTVTDREIAQTIFAGGNFVAVSHQNRTLDKYYLGKLQSTPVLFGELKRYFCAKL